MQVIAFCGLVDPSRPLNERELSEKQPCVCKVEERNREVVVQLKANKNLSKSFFFDSAYSPSATQRDIFDVCNESRTSS